MELFDTVNASTIIGKINTFIRKKCTLLQRSGRRIKPSVNCHRNITPYLNLSMTQFIISRKRVVLYGAAAVLCLTSCLGPHKVNKWVAQHYREEPPNTAPKKSESIIISSSLPPTGDRPSETAKNTADLLPLLFYWQFDYRNTCTLNPKLALDNFSSTVDAYSRHGLRQKIGSNRLELRVEQIPQVFVVDDKGHIIWVIVTMVGWEKLSVQPEVKDLVVSYRLIGPANEELKKGSVTIADKEDLLTLGMFKSLKKLTKQHLSEYDANISAMARKCVDRIAAEL